MRYHFAVLFLGSLLLSACAKPAASVTDPLDEPYTRYHLEKGVVRYVLTGPQEGTEVITFDQWGMRERKETHVTVTLQDDTQDVNRLTLVEGPMTTIIDLDSMMGSKSEQSAHIAMAEQAGTHDIAAAVLENLKNAGAVNTGMDVVAGQTCDVWEVASAGLTLCIWEGLPIRTTVTMNGQTVQAEAASIDLTAPVTEADFALPISVNFGEADGSSSGEVVNDE